MFRQTRFQQGSLQREARKKGPKIWIFRDMKKIPNGKRKRQYSIIGTVEECQQSQQHRRLLPHYA